MKYIIFYVIIKTVNFCEEKGIYMSDEFEEEKLDSPLVVHKVTDASYYEAANSMDVDITHVEESKSTTLERHRFRRVKKRRKSPYVILVIVIIIAVVCVLYFGGVFPKGEEKTTETTTKGSYVTNAENRFKGTITVKGAYIFFEGKEVDGITGLTREIKYLDAGTEFIVYDEDADSAFLEEEILPLLKEYNINYETKLTISSGLVSKYETVTQQSAEEEPPATSADNVQE